MSPDEPWIGWVDNGDDSPHTVAYLHHLAQYRRHPGAAAGDFAPIVVRPTPGGDDHMALGFDLLTALGKSPEIMHAERTRLRGGNVWDNARAWLIGSQTTDVFLDRAHQLSTKLLLDLANAAGRAHATTWLIWSSPDTDLAAATIATITEAGYQVDRIPAPTLRTMLPDLHAAGPQQPPPDPPWSPLPAADFRAACRRHLGRDAFARVDAVYRQARERTDAWMDSHASLTRPEAPTLPPALADIAGPLLGWLRDEQIGPTKNPARALITLRATQAALFGHAILLSWQPDALGANPAARLIGDLNRQAARALTTGASTADAAGTVLALHLNLPPTDLHCFTVGGIATDGSILTPPADSFTNHHHGAAHTVLADQTPSGIRERACLGVIRIPDPARPIIAAHLAYRRLQGADDHDPFFAYRHDPRRRPTAALRDAAIRLCERIHVNPPWLHRDPCKYGADIGLTPRTHTAGSSSAAWPWPSSTGTPPPDTRPTGTPVPTS